MKYLKKVLDFAQVQNVCFS